MVFPSLPLYHLDPPPNWAQQQPNQQHPGVIPTQNPQAPPPPPPPAAADVGGGGSGSIRLGSMADRARLAKITQPEAALKCPRCESTNTKFCYYNNYSLSQPRHFCKTCRRYWTRGGALRNVPVGGGCRRKNKRSKGKSKSLMSPTKEVAAAAAASASANNSSSSCCPSSSDHHHHHLIGHHFPSQLLFPSTTTSHHYCDDVVSVGINGLQFGATNITDAEFQTGGNHNTNGGSILSNGFVSSLPHHQQFPALFANVELEPPSIELLQHFGRSEIVQVEPSRSTTLLYSGLSGGISTTDQLTATIKMEDNILGLSGNNVEHFWPANNGNAWNIDNNIPNFVTSSSTTHLL